MRQGISIPLTADAFAYLEMVTEDHNKFWEASLHGTRLTTRWGRIGFVGQKKVADFDEVGTAYAEYEAQTSKKLAKGYVIDVEKGKRLRDIGDSLAILGREL